MYLWYEMNPARLLLEQEAVATRFPQFRLFREGRQLGWVGELLTNHRQRYQILLAYPDDFPHIAPRVYPIDPVIVVWKDVQAGVLKHQYKDGSLCLYAPTDRSFAPNTTAATVIGWAAAWLFAYECWMQSGQTHWPGVEAD